MMDSVLDNTEYWSWICQESDILQRYFVIL